jgi:RNA polymerase sigma factor (sigma-70 family)
MNCRIVPSERQEELLRLARRGDRNALSDLAESVLPWAVRCANKYSRFAGLPDDEVHAAAGLAVTKAIQTWDPRRGTLTTYVHARVKWEAYHAGNREIRRRARETFFPRASYEAARAGHPLSPWDNRLLPVIHRVLPARLAFIIECRFFHGATMVDVGGALGVTKQRIGQLTNLALEHLQARIAKEPEQDL